MARNPVWTRDETILLLDLYFRVGRRPVSARHPDVVRFSMLLNRLPVHPAASRQTSFRNPNGIAMKLANLLRLDPLYTGRGLGRGNQLESIIWNEFAGEPLRLEQTAAAIRAHIGLEGTEPLQIGELGEDFPEGRILTRVHYSRERSARAVREKKRHVQGRTGRLCCEACEFDFAVMYGTLGEGFAECHHRTPLAALSPDSKTQLSDLAIVCANCHRILHKSRPTMMSVEELRALLEARHC